jgi:hypothetical protein
MVFSFAGIGCPERPFTAADPTLDDLLPVGDAAWDQGVRRFGHLITVYVLTTSRSSKPSILSHYHHR